MSATNEQNPGGRRVMQVIASEADRARSFRQARRHSILVRTAKLALPVIAILAIGGYAAALLAIGRVKSKGIETGKITIDPKNLTMQAPKYDGFAKDGSRYVIKAREAVTDLRQTGPVRLNVIEGEITQTTGVVTNLKANWGTFDQRKDVLELYEKIDIDSSSGMKARLTRATVWTKDSRIESSEPIYAETETGVIRARQMTLNSKTKRGSFSQDVHVTMRSNPQGKPKDAQNGAAAKAASVLPGLQANSGEPIDVKSEQLEVDDIAKTAQFRRDVIARQGDAVLQAPELDIAYEGRSAMSESAAQPREGGAQTKLKAIAARGGVVMTSKDDRAEASTLDYDAASERARLAGEVVLTSVNERRVTARAAELDQKADTALLTGDVVVTQGKNTMRGQRLFLDRKAQRTRLESPAEGGKGAGRIQTVFYQNAAQKPEGAKAGAKGSDPGNPLAISFKSDPNQPIDIAADTLDVADADKKAVYRGTVVAKQGEFQVETAEMTAFYSGQAGLGSAPKPAAAKAGTKGETGTAAQLTRVEARQRVKVTGKDGQRAEAENADFDVKQNKIVMWGGTVRVEQVSAANPSKPNVVTAPPGARLVIDMNSGESRFEQIDAKPAGPAVSAAGPATDAASAATAAAAKSGSEPQKPRMRAVIFPQQAKEAAAQKAGELGIEKPAGKAQGEKAGTSKAPTSAWEATTAGPKERRP